MTSACWSLPLVSLPVVARCSTSASSRRSLVRAGCPPVAAPLRCPRCRGIWRRRPPSQPWPWVGPNALPTTLSSLMWVPSAARGNSDDFKVVARGSHRCGFKRFRLSWSFLSRSWPCGTCNCSFLFQLGLLTAIPSILLSTRVLWSVVLCSWVCRLLANVVHGICR